MITVVIEGTLPCLNDFIRAMNYNRHRGNSMKQECTDICHIAFKKQCKQTFNKVFITFHWIEPNMRRDKDNIAFAKKFILDGMVQNGTLKNDGWKQVADWEDKFSVDKDNPRIEITVREVSK
jgi:Holliday junction resolvase RusA-like endonuclease